MTSCRRYAVAAWLAVALLAACSREPAAGPGPIVWDRDTCEHCWMAIGERHFAAQIRDAGGRLHRFDDLGCALLWQADSGASGEPREFWVYSQAADGWVEARSARFADGERSPMGHGFAAREGGALGIEGVRARVREQNDERRSARR